MLISAKSMEDIDCLKAQLADEFDMNDLGHTRKILGVEIYRDRSGG